MKYLGVDFGLKRVGLSISEGELSSPYKIIEGNSINDLLEKLKKEAVNFDKVVIGLPDGKMGKVVKKVVRSLKSFGFDVIEVDETLSTQNATKQMVQLELSRKKRAGNDSYAAAIILQNYLDEKN